ncbi:SIMPL domain-containing protein [Rheinheimera sp.]|uniref:SIMPL domain-containing protein n=1 Tax=Rheinheimera sp. TaxID=1869214 RepID=UPI003AF96AB7
MNAYPKLMSAALVSALLLSSPLWAAEPATPLVSVSGSAVLQAKPDAVKLTMQIQQKSEQVSSAKTRVDEQTDQLSKALLKLGIKPEFFSNAPLRIQPDYQHDPEQKLPQRYLVAREVNVTLQDLSLYSTVLQKAADLGVTQLNQTEFLVSDAPKLYQQALLDAYANARSKAELLAKASQMSLGNPQRIQEQGNAPAPVMRMAKAMADGAEMAFGQTDIRAEVMVEFEMSKP